MKKVFAILSVTAILAFPVVMTAQNYVPTEVAVSKEKVKMDGKIYYSHIVLEKQTLFSIAKAYGVTVQDIYDANANLKANGLKKNAIILIPAESAYRQDIAHQAEEAVRVAEEKEPEVNNAVFAAASEAVTVSEEKPDKNSEVIKDKDYFIKHTVKWYEDLDSISEKYGVPVEIIMKLNDLKGRKLTSRQKLWIPKSPEHLDAYIATGELGYKISKIENTSKAEEPQAQKEQENERQENPFNIFQYQPKTEVKIAMLLPLNASGAKPSEGNMDFYSGALLAAKAMGEEGVNVDLSVYDCSGGNIPLTPERISASDIVIGPVAGSDIVKLFEKNQDSTYVVSPLDPRAANLVYNYKNLIQAPASSESQYKDLVNWICDETGEKDRIIVISEKGAKDFKYNQLINGTFQEAQMDFKTFSYNILEGRQVGNTLKTMMTSEGANRVLVASESEAFVNDVVRNLNLLVFDKFNVVLFAPSRIRSFETIEVDNFHNTNLHCSLSYYIDYSSPEVQDFLMDYRALYNAEPSPFAYQGYDLTYYFISTISQFGNRWKERFTDGTASLLQSDYSFERINEYGGFINTGIRRIVYKSDYGIELVR